MSSVTAAEVRAFLLSLFAEPLAALGLEPSQVDDDFDLMRQGVIDSMGILEMIGAIETRFGAVPDFEAMDPENLTVLGPLCAHAAQSINAQRQIG